MCLCIPGYYFDRLCDSCVACGNGTKYCLGGSESCLEGSIGCVNRSRPSPPKDCAPNKRIPAGVDTPSDAEACK